MSSGIPSHLRWTCRRGMLELDILLGRFLEEAYLTLSEQDQLLFEALLRCEDQELFEWLTGKKIPPNADIQSMIEKILQHAKTPR